MTYLRTWIDFQKGQNANIWHPLTSMRILVYFMTIYNIFLLGLRIYYILAAREELFFRGSEIRGSVSNNLCLSDFFPTQSTLKNLPCFYVGGGGCYSTLIFPMIWFFGCFSNWKIHIAVHLLWPMFPSILSTLREDIQPQRFSFIGGGGGTQPHL